MLTIEEIKELTKDLYIGQKPIHQPTTFTKLYLPIEILSTVKVKNKNSYFIGTLDFSLNYDPLFINLSNIQDWTASVYSAGLTKKVQSSVNSDLYTVFYSVRTTTTQSPMISGNEDWISLGTFIHGEPVKIGYIKLLSDNLGLYGSSGYLNYYSAYNLSSDKSGLVIFENIEYSNMGYAYTINGQQIYRPHMNAMFSGYQVIIG